MTPRSNRLTSALTPMMLILGVSTLSTIGLSGCGNDDQAKQAVQDADLEIRKVSIGDATISQDFTNKVFTNAEQLTSGVAGSDSPFAEAASVSLSTAKLGQSNVASNEASQVETEAIHKSRVIRAHLSEWIAMNAIAMASGNLDVSDDKASLRDLITMRENDVTEYSDLYDSLQDEITKLEGSIADLEARSIEQRNESAKYELQMTSVDAGEAAQLAQRVREHSLRADDFELQAVRLQGKVDQLRPGAHEVKLQVEKAQSQIELIESSIEELDQQVRDSKADAAQARASAEQAKSKVAQLLNDLESFRSDTVIPAEEKVVSLINQSLNAARDAKDAVKASGSLAKASAQEHLARNYARQARGEYEMISLYGSIKDSGMPGSWDSKIADHTEAYNTLLEQSNQAFQDAASALRSVRARGEEGDKLEAAATRLDQLGGVEPEPEYSDEYEEDNYDDSDSYDEDEWDEDEEENDDAEG